MVQLFVHSTTSNHPSTSANARPASLLVRTPEGRGWLTPGSKRRCFLCCFLFISCKWSECFYPRIALIWPFLVSLYPFSLFCFTMNFWINLNLRTDSPGHWRCDPWLWPLGLDIWPGDKRLRARRKGVSFEVRSDVDQVCKMTQCLSCL